MGRRNISWFLSELPKLEAEEVIDNEVAERLRSHYEISAGSVGKRVILAVCAVFGALLIGGGVILLLAHNWEYLGRGARAAIALVPLIAVQALVVWVLLRRVDSVAWREGTATLLALSVATAIALVDQTYHTGGDLESFLWRWAWLLAALPWLLGSTAVAMIYLAILTWWAGMSAIDGTQVLMIWPLALAVIPHAVQVLREDRRGLRAANLQWAMAIFLCFATGIGLERRVPGLWIGVYCGLFALMIVVGAAVRDSEERMWRRPLEAVGFLGSMVLWVILSFAEPWQHIGWHHIRTAEQYHSMASWLDVALAIGLPVAAVFVAFRWLDVSRYKLQFLWLLSIPVAAVSWPIAAAIDEEWIGALAFNLVLFAVGVGTIALGARQQSLARVNLGMSVVAIQVVVRFFSSELGFVARGLAFILIGVGFLLANVVLAKKMRSDEEGGK